MAQKAAANHAMAATSIPCLSLLLTVVLKVCRKPQPEAGAQSTSLCCDPPLQVSNAVGRVRSGAAACLDFSSDICFAGHGYSLLLEAEAGGTCHRLGRVSCVKPRGWGGVGAGGDDGCQQGILTSSRE